MRGSTVRVCFDNQEVTMETCALMEKLQKFDAWLYRLPRPERKRLKAEFQKCREIMGVREAIETVEKMAKTE